MSFQFILGDGAKDHLSEVVIDADNWLKNGKKRQVFFIVPNNMKFTLEVEILKKFKKIQEIKGLIYANIDLQILSFSRLAWYLLQQNDYQSKEHISHLGVELILYDLINSYSEELKTFKYEKDKASFLEELAKLFEEFLIGGLTPEILTNYLITQVKSPELIEELEQVNSKYQTDKISYQTYLKKILKLKEDSLEWRKLSDFLLLYQMFEEKIRDYQFGEYSFLDDLLNLLDNNLDLKQTRFIFYGFHHFQAKEVELIEKITKVAGSVMVDLILDPKVIKRGETELFATTYQTYNQLKFLNTEKNIEISTTHVSSKINILNNAYKQVFEGEIANEFAPLENSDSVQIKSYENRHQEVSHVASKIKQLVASGKYRYQDIRIITRDLDGYKLEIEPIFTSQDLPYALFVGKSMQNHPLIIFIKQVINLIQNDFKSADIIKFLKTKIYSFDDEELNIEKELDLLENIIVGYIPKWQNFLKANVLIFDKEETKNEKINLVKKYQKYLQKIFEPFQSNLQKSSNYQTFVSLLVEFLLMLKIPENLLNLANEFTQKGQLEEAKRQQQVWQTLMDTLDEFVALLGDKEVTNFKHDFKMFADLLTIALNKATYSQVPTTLDQIEVLDVIRQPITKTKVTFILGVSENLFPKKVMNTSLLTDEERIKLHEYLIKQEKQAYLTADTNYLQKNELFFAYLSSLSATEQVIFSYSKKTTPEQSEAWQLSPYLELLRQTAYTGIKVQNYSLFPKIKDTDYLSYLINQRQFVSLYTLEKQLNKTEAGFVMPIWLEQIYQTLDLDDKEQQIVKSLETKNIAQTLENVTNILYPTSKVQASASEFEVYYQCQYRHLLSRQLKLVERKVYQETESVIIGSIYHEIFDQSVQELLNETSLNLAENKNWMPKVHEITNRILKDNGYDSKLMGTAKANYLRYRLEQKILKTAQAIQKQMKFNSNWQIAQTEVPFGFANQGSKKSLPPISLELVNNKQLNLRGMIDRVDELRENDDIYLTVVDYKSGDKDFKWNDFYNGRILQLPTYLLALENSFKEEKKYHLSGAGYEQIKYPDIEKLDYLAEFKLQGFYTKDYLEELREGLGEDLSKLKSLVGVEVTKKGDFSKRSLKRIVDEKDMDDILKYTKKLYKQAGNQLQKGNLKINPCFPSDCQNCPFRSICQFDPLLAENNYRNFVEAKSKDDVLNLIRKELGND